MAEGSTHVRALRALAVVAALFAGASSGGYAATAAAPTAPTLAASIASPLPPGDPARGPHARDEAQHQVARPALAPATSAPRPLLRPAASRTGVRAATGSVRANPALLPSNPKLAREVFGFAPYWELGNNGNWNYSLLSTVAYFGLDVQADGSFNTSSSNAGFNGWESQNFVTVINNAHAQNDRVVLVIKAFDDATINAIVSNPSATQNAINWTIQSIRSRNLDGVNIDFEGATSGSYPNLPSQFSAFVGTLSSQVHAAIPGSVVSVNTYSGSASWDSGFMNIGQLAPSVDSIFVMAYDMGFSNLPGHASPNAPLNGWTYNDTTAVQQYLSKAPASKVILGVPYYGYKWSTNGNGAYAATSGSGTADPYSQIIDDFNCAPQLSRNWDSTASSPWASWWSPATNDPCGGNHNSWRELYYDNATSLMAKYDLVNGSNLQGTGMWALGYDGTAPDLWQAIAAKMRASWAATFDTSGVPQSWAVNLTRSLSIPITNVGNSTWPAGGSNPVRLALHFFTAGTGALLTDQRFNLPADVAPGQTITMTVPVTAPATANAGTLQVTMVKEQQLWFKQWANVPVSVQPGTFMASYDASAMPRSWIQGQTQTFTVTVTNTGNQVWPSTGATRVRLGLHFATGLGQPWSSWLTDARFELPGDLAPGQSATIAVSATAPASSAGSVLEAELVKEGQFWFYPTGPAAVTIAAPAWSAGYDLAQVPHQWAAGQSQSVSVKVTNSGNQSWPAGGSNPVHLGLHFARAAGLPPTRWLSDQRVTLPADLSPGQSVTLTASLTAPSASGALILEAQMVKEQLFWFSQAGAASVETGSVSWLAGYDLSAAPRDWVAGASQPVSIIVSNTGNQNWPASGANPVRLGLHFAGGAGQALSDQRLALPSDLAPGQSVTLTTTLAAPAAGGAVILEAQMVKESQFWFVSRGAQAVTEAAPSWIADVDLHQAPPTWSPGQTQTVTISVLNAGNQLWPASGNNPVHLSVHFAGDAGLSYSRWLSDQRVSLPADLAPGQTVSLSVSVSAPSGDTGGVFEVEAVKEWQFWFAQRAPRSFLAS